MSVCVCVCLCACVCVCVSVCMCTCVCVCVCVFLQVHAHSSVRICVFAGGQPVFFSGASLKKIVSSNNPDLCLRCERVQLFFCFFLQYNNNRTRRRSEAWREDTFLLVIQDYSTGGEVRLMKKEKKGKRTKGFVGFACLCCLPTRKIFGDSGSTRRRNINK